MDEGLKQVCRKFTYVKFTGKRNEFFGERARRKSDLQLSSFSQNSVFFSVIFSSVFADFVLISKSDAQTAFVSHDKRDTKSVL